MVIGHREIGNPRFLIFTNRKTKKRREKKNKMVGGHGSSGADDASS
jgi:hypothetical protein